MNKKNFGVSLLLLLFLFQSLYTLFHNNLIIDEPAYIAVAYYFVKYADTSMAILHPPLTMLMSGFPLLFANVNEPYSYQKCVDVGYYKCSQDFFFGSGNDADEIGIYARIPFLMLSVILGLLLFFFTEKIYGTKAGFVALALYSFSPTILSFNTIVFTDFLIAFFVFSTIYLFWKLLKNYSRKWLILTGISFGLAFASKFTAIFLIPVILILFAVKACQDQKNKKALLKKYSKQFLWILAIGIIVLYSSYFFTFGTISESIPQRYVKSMQSAIDNFGKESIKYKISNYLINGLKMPMPQYIAGFAGQYQVESTKRKLGYINGEIYYGGKWYYFPEVMLIKNPIPLLILFAMGVYISIMQFRKNTLNELFIMLPIIFFVGPFILANFNLGLRHVLPIFPFVFMLCSRAADTKSYNSKFLFRSFVIILLAWYVISSLLIMPHYAAYFNEFVGGAKNGHKYLISSNLDMGQDLKGLRNYLNENNITKIKLAYHGAFDPEYYNISYEPLPMESYIPWAPGFGLEESGYKEDCSKKYGIIAISVSNLHGYNLINQSCFEWLNKYKPIKSIGNTIFVYDIKK